MAKARRIDFSPGDWIGGTLELSLEEEGLYIRICALIWNRGGRIHEDLLRAATKEHWSKVKAILARLDAKGKIIRNGLEIGQKRAENELENAEIRRRNASTNGAKGGRPNGLDKATGLETEKLTRASSPSPPPPPPEEPPPTPRKRGARLEGFEEWYAGYPHKVGKGEAERAWPKARMLASFEELCAGVTRYIASKPADYSWCGPGVWLNKKRWLDQPSNAENPQNEQFNGRSAGPPPGSKPRPEDLFPEIKEPLH